MADEQSPQQKKPLTEADIKEEPASSSQKNTVKIVLIVIGVLVGLSLLGAAVMGWVGVRLFERATNSSVNLDNGSISIADDNGEFELDTAQELPKDFPEEVPLYEPSELQSSSRIRQNDDVVWSASFVTNDDYTTVSNHYEEILDQDNWTLESIFESGELTNIAASNDTDGLNIQLNIIENAAEDNTGINFTVIRSRE